MRTALAVMFLLVAATAILIGQATENATRVVVVLDDFHIAFRSTPRMRDTLLRSVLPPLVGRTMSLVTTGYSSVAVAPTRDTSALIAAVRRVVGGSLRPEHLVDQSQSGIAERLRRERTAIATAQEVVRAVPVGAPGAVMIYIGGGWGDDVLAPDLADLVTTATRANIRIYTLDSHAILDDPDSAPNHSIERAWAAYLVNAQDTLRMLAERTGGQYVSARWDIDTVMNEIAREPKNAR